VITAIRRRLERRDEGFTLIELLIVVIIIGILAAIAIPTFLNQREGAYEAAVKSDLRNAAIRVEQDYTTSGTYVGASTGNESEGVNVTLAESSATAYCLEGDSTPLGAGVEFHLDSTVGRPAAGPCV
jgi:type IV pilus assembly protein PilA